MIPRVPIEEKISLCADIFGPAGCPVRFTVGNGGAGVLGLVGALCDDFLALHQRRYRIGWIKAGAGECYDKIESGHLDVGLTYVPPHEKHLLRSGKVCLWERVFEDRFILVGPKSDPAGLARNPVTAHNVSSALAHLAAAAVSEVTASGFKQSHQHQPRQAVGLATDGASTSSSTSSVPFLTPKVRFISRDDSSATTQKERLLWQTVLLQPWQDPLDCATWYLKIPGYPSASLQTANELGAYALNDISTWRANPKAHSNLRIFTRHQPALADPCSVIVANNYDPHPHHQAPSASSPSAPVMHPPACDPEALLFAQYLLTPRAQALIAHFGADRTPAGGAPFVMPAHPSEEVMLQDENFEIRHGETIFDHTPLQANGTRSSSSFGSSSSAMSFASSSFSSSTSLRAKM